MNIKKRIGWINFVQMNILNFVGLFAFLLVKLLKAWNFRLPLQP